MLEDKEKDSYIRIRIDKQTKDKFMQLCNDKDMNSSKLIRRLISEWVNNQEQ